MIKVNVVRKLLNKRGGGGFIEEKWRFLAWAVANIEEKWRFLGKLRWYSIIICGGLMGGGELGAAGIFENWQKGSWGSFSQGFFYDLHSIDRSRYYEYGDVLYEYEDREDRAGEEIVGQEYIFESRTAYYYRYVAILFNYTYEKRLVRYFNNLGIENVGGKATRDVHTIMSHLYFTLEPLRLGVSYYKEFSATPQPVAFEQSWSLRGSTAFSTHLQLQFAKIPYTPLGLTFLYELGFDPEKPVAEFARELFHRVGINIDLYFTYYSQFRFAVTHERTMRDVVIRRTVEVGGATARGDGNYELRRSDLKRYYVDYIFIYKLTNYLSLNILMGQMLYSNFESPAYRFKLGITVHVGN